LKVLLAVIDALSSRVIRPALEAGRLPNLRALAEAGRLHWDSTAIFPSITPAATGALITGAYPADSGMSGAFFYDADDEQVRYYGDDLWPIMQQGFSHFFEEYLVRMNRDRLRVETIHETVESAGLTAACLNYLWYYGNTPKTVQVPLTLRLWPGVPHSETVRGPSLLGLGDFVQLDPEHPAGYGGPLHRFGFNDQNTLEQLLTLARRSRLPDFTVAYFPDNDFESHTRGPQAALDCVEHVDGGLGEFISLRGGLDRLLEETAIVITGDHSQSDLPHGKTDTSIDLHKWLSDFSMVSAGRPWQDEDLLICPNMRAAQIYFHPRVQQQSMKIIATLLEEPRIDQIISREPGADAADRYRVWTRDRGELLFWPAAPAEAGHADVYGTRWSWQGNLAAVDGRLQQDGHIQFEEYPNALERLACAFDARVSGDLWVTARPGFEFHLPGTSIHRRGSHGSLHESDSTSPLLVAGGPNGLDLVRPPRAVDVAPLCLQILGLRSRYAVGISRVARPA
jgi:hypothetical protein